MKNQQTPNPQGGEWRIPDVARHFGTTTAYWYKLLREGKVQGRRDERGQWLIDAATVAAWEEKRTAAAAARPQNTHPQQTVTEAPPRRRATDRVQSEFRFVLMPTEETMDLYRTIVEHLADLTQQVAQLRRQQA